MNRALLPQDRGGRGGTPSGQSGRARAKRCVGGLVGGVEDSAKRATPPAVNPAALSVIDRPNSALHGIRALAAFVLRGLDLDAALLCGGGEETSDAMCLPIGRLHDFCKRRALHPPDHFQNFRSLALRTGSGGLGARALRGRLGGFRILLRRGSLGFATRGGFRALGRAPLLAGTFLRGALLRRAVRALSRHGGGCVGFFVSHIGQVLFCACFAHHDSSLWCGVIASRFCCSHREGEGLATELEGSR